MVMFGSMVENIPHFLVYFSLCRPTRLLEIAFRTPARRAPIIVHNIPARYVQYVVHNITIVTGNNIGCHAGFGSKFLLLPRY